MTFLSLVSYNGAVFEADKLSCFAISRDDVAEQLLFSSMHWGMNNYDCIVLTLDICPWKLLP